MSSLINMITSNMDKVLKVPLFAILSTIIVIIVYRYIKKDGIAKYIPGLILLCISLVTIIIAMTNLTSQIGLTMLEFFVLTLASGIISLCIAWFLDLFFVKGKK